MGERRRSPEKAVERQGDELMAAFGFTAIRFSQARATMQTRGIPDRRYYRPGDDFAGIGWMLWWEAKAGTKQSVHQKAFQSLVESCGEFYLVGGIDVLEEWLVWAGFAKRVPGGIEGLRRTKTA